MEIAWFKKIRKPKQPVEHKRIQVPEGLWVKCSGCKEIIYKKEVLRNANVCPKCNYHFRISARERLSALFDDARYQEVDTDIYSVDSLKFRDVKPYRDRLREYREKTGLNDAIINARGTIGGLQVMMSVMEYGFMGGSMGSAVGEGHPGRRKGSGRADPACHHLLLGRGPHAGRSAVADADGQDQRRP